MGATFFESPLCVIITKSDWALSLPLGQVISLWIGQLYSKFILCSVELEIKWARRGYRHQQLERLCAEPY